MPNGDERPRVAIDLRSRRHRRQLRWVLGDGYRVDDFALDEAGQPGFDLAVLDVNSLAHRREALAAARSKVAPVLLPTLLVAAGQRLPGPRVQRELGVQVDEVLRVPTSSAELRARVENLLRLRRLSLELDTRYRDTQRKLAGTNRALQTLHAANEILVYADSEAQLLEDICGVITERERYALACVGFVKESDDGRSSIEIEAAAGEAKDYSAWLDLDRRRTGRGPAWRAIESGESQVVSDLTSHPGVPRDIREMADRYRLHSVLAMSIRAENGPPGVLIIYGDEVGGTSEQELELLERLGHNLRYGLDALRAKRDRERQKAAIEDLAYSDSLTGLSNRNDLVNRIDKMIRTSDADHGLAVLFIDLDDFKLINDALGHAAGDHVLREIARRLLRAVRPGDLVARQGGDEFIVVMAEPARSSRRREEADSGTEPGHCAHSLAKRLRERLREPMTIQGHDWNVEVSVGISLYPDHGVDADTLIECADTAMYAAKRADGGVCIYSQTLSQNRKRRLSLAARLKEALADEAFAVRYQPIFDTSSQEIIAAEALIRWPQGDGTEMSPGEFMPVAEASGLIGPISTWVLGVAARQSAAWLTEGLELRMSVNLSPAQLNDANALDTLLGTVRPHAEPGRIELELTEGVLMTGGAATEQVLHGLHEAGFAIAIDDFGTGHSSLARLQQLPIDTLKIDKAFVDAIGTGQRGALIVRAVHELAGILGLASLAEGVETEAQRRELVAMGCRQAQGFLLSGAVPPERLAAMAAWPRSPPDDRPTAS